MITDLFSAIVFDALKATSESDFFALEPIKRKDALAKNLSKTYPKTLTVYLADRSKKQFDADIKEVIALLGAKNSLLTERLDAKKNAAFGAFLAFLEKDLLILLREPLYGKTALDSYLKRFAADETEAEREKRILIREAQELLADTLKKESAVIQIATQLPQKEQEAFENMIRKEIPEGIPAIAVNHALLGGSRIFRGGKLLDKSWHAKLSTLFSRLR